VPLLAWLPLVILPMLIVVWVMTRQLALPTSLLGLRIRNRTFHLMMMSGGLGLGALQYVIFRPASLSETFGAGATVLPFLLLVLVSGGLEEIIFRGLVQTAAWPLMGPRAILYSAALFALLHIGYLSLPAVLFAFLLGLLFAHIVHWSGSLLGVALLHGTTSMTHLVLLPTFFETSAPSHGTILWLTAMGMATPAVIVTLLTITTIGLTLVLIVLSYLCALP
jgi:hypothetical protein